MSSEIRRKTTYSGSGCSDGVDRISYLPDSILLEILSSLDTKYAVQSSILSKQWKNLWTTLVNLNLDSNLFKSLPNFHEFVRQVLDSRDGTMKINTFNFHQPGRLNTQILDTIAHYAFSHKVQHLTVSLECKVSHTFPSFTISSDSLQSLNLKNLEYNYEERVPSCHVVLATTMRKSYFKQLVSLNLEYIRFGDADPFSGFPNLKNLVLINSTYFHYDYVTKDITAMKVISPTLSTLTLVFDNKRMPPAAIVVSTPKLRSLEVRRYPGFLEDFLLVKSSHGLPVLDCATLDVNDTEDDLVILLEWVGNARYVTLSSLMMIELHSRADPDKLAKNPSPFALNLKTLKFTRARFGRERRIKVPAPVMSYLLRNTSCENVVMAERRCKNCRD